MSLTSWAVNMGQQSARWIRSEIQLALARTWDFIRLMAASGPP